MNTQQLHDALTELPEELIASTAQARGKKQVIWGPWVALVACACLVMVLGVKVLPFLSLNSAAPENAGMSDWLYGAADGADVQKSESASWESCELLARVVEVHEGVILVRALEGQDIAEESLISVPVSGEETYVVGDRLRIFHNGQLLETWPLQLGKIFFVERME